MIGASYLLTGFSQVYLCVLKSVERAKTSTVISCTALLNDCIWTLAFSTYSIILGHMNSDMVAAASVAALTALIIILIRKPAIGLFDLTLRAQDYLNFMLPVSSYYVVGQAINTLTIAGIFRAGGNSRFGLICDFIVIWLISVPLGLLSAFVLHLPPKAVYFILCLDEF